MKVIIDLIEDIRESIDNAEAYVLHAGLLKEDLDDTSKLHYEEKRYLDNALIFSDNYS